LTPYFRIIVDGVMLSFKAMIVNQTMFQSETSILDLKLMTTQNYFHFYFELTHCDSRSGIS